MTLIKEEAKFARRREPRFQLIGGAVCLDFINTLDDRYSGTPKELLPAYPDLARFGEDAGILSTAQVDRLFNASTQRKEEAEHTLKHAIRMRQAMFEVFGAIVNRKPVPPMALMVLNGYVQEAAQHVSLVPAKEHLEWQFDSSANELDAPLWPIARSAGELLASDQLRFVRACAAKTCEWFFLDESKNHRRRWCDMTQCGNRAKVQRFYSRKKKEG